MPSNPMTAREWARLVRWMDRAVEEVPGIRALEMAAVILRYKSSLRAMQTTIAHADYKDSIYSKVKKEEDLHV